MNVDKISIGECVISSIVFGYNTRKVMKYELWLAESGVAWRSWQILCQKTAIRETKNWKKKTTLRHYNKENKRTVDKDIIAEKGSILLMAIQKYSIRSNYIKSKAAGTQGNSKSRWSADIHAAVNHIIAKYSNGAHEITKIGKGL